MILPLAGVRIPSHGHLGYSLGHPSSEDATEDLAVQGYLLAYSFLCFCVGIACLGINLVSAWRKDDDLARTFLWFYVALSLLVFGALLRSFFELVPDAVPPAARFGVEYMESFIGRYGVMFTLPLFAHRVFAVSDSRRYWAIAAVVALAFVGQHVTEFLLTKQWDERGDVFEDVLLAGIGLYALGLGMVRFNAAGVYRPLAVRFVVLIAAGLPGIAYDLFISGDGQLQFYPLFYCIGSVVTTHCLVRRQAGPGTISPQWGLSEREAQVAGLVQRGLSNKAIAEQLNISTNTVKTHLRSVFDKSGLRSRFELISGGRR